VADLAMGELSDRIFHEGRRIEPEPAKAARVAIDRLVLDAPGIRSVVSRQRLTQGTHPTQPKRRSHLTQMKRLIDDGPTTAYFILV
jgi:hypothetical protein